jgi:hypothetical protein
VPRSNARIVTGKVVPIIAALVERQLVSEKELSIRREVESGSAEALANSWKQGAGMERLVLRVMRNEEEISA